MEIFVKFITIVSWLAVVGSGLLVVLRIYGFSQYSELHQSLDKLNGVRRVFPIKVPGITFLVSLSWIIATF